MPQPPIAPITPNGLETIAELVETEPGLIANIYPGDIQGGADAARQMNEVFETAMTATGVNTDGILTPEDLYILSAYIQNNAALYAAFIEGHGDDEGNEETGFHLVQGDGGALEFRGRDFIDTVADAIYHLGFDIVDGRFENEDGNENERVTDVAGWMNYFVNGESRVYGTDAAETLRSGDYSFALADAAHEIFTAGAGNDQIWAEAGDDTVFGGGGNDTSAGGDGDDYLNGQVGFDEMWGEGGNDTLLGQNGEDRLGGGEGDDFVNGGAGNDRLYGNEGDDTIWAGIGNDVLSGDIGNDSLRADGGNDTLWGDEGNDVLFAGRGADNAHGGSGNDTVLAGAGNDSVTGGDGNDALRGAGGFDTLRGGEGDDDINGNGGNDSISGDEGNDLLRGEAGQDTLHGGEGNDTIYGQGGDDSIRGNDGNDRLIGSGGNDDMHGGDGIDVLSGGTGNDTVSGGDGADRVAGGAGADLILDYEDIEARDVFVFNPGDSGTTDGTMDEIRGFTSIIDKIDLSAFGGLTFVESETFSGTRAEVLFDGDFVQIDSDGDGAVDEMIELVWVNAVEAADFIL
ncbi:calcium-binding protein [uncultured Tateyamaria sp.]|uniref:calcium-binding protein n=1 Tax=uncultured Tateyamaria sp. TaxID=455651 RepID=UPI00262D589C|nr:calcium-binding protein [uncultured Tateyamaria sp.]